MAWQGGGGVEWLIEWAAKKSDSLGFMMTGLALALLLRSIHLREVKAIRDQTRAELLQMIELAYRIQRGGSSAVDGARTGPNGAASKEP